MKSSNYSIKRTTVSSSIAGILIASVFALIIANEFISQWLTKNYDESLIAKINVLQTITEFEAEEVALEFDFADEFMPEYSRELSPEYFQVWTNNDTTFEKSHSLSDGALEFKKIPLNSVLIDNLELPDGRAGRAAYISFSPQVDFDDNDKPLTPQEEEAHIKAVLEKLAPSIPIVTIAIAKERESLDEIIAFSNIILISSIIVFAIVLAFIVSWSIKKGLSPLKILQSQIQVIDFKQDNAYLKLNKEPVELSSLIYRFNRMLDSVREGFKREQQFSSDVAHELKTPIAEIRTISEVALLNKDESNDYTRSLEDIQEVSVQMGTLVNQLLALARSEIDRDGMKRSRIDVEQLVRNTLSVHEAEILERGLNVSISTNSGPYIHTLILEFSQVVDNLISNAIRYSPKDETIIIELQNDENNFTLLVKNMTDSLEESDLDNMFKRLWKKDQARTDFKHSGIGLSLVKIYCEALDYVISTELIDNCFTISISGRSHE